MTRNIRHGDIAFFSVDKLPDGLTQSVNDINGLILQAGSGGNPHTFTGGKYYSKQDGDFVIGYLDAKDTKLLHAEHSPDGVSIEDGVYEVRRQVEQTPEGMRVVED